MSLRFACCGLGPAIYCGHHQLLSNEEFHLTLTSMTGFARASGELGPHRWTWEIKSVNGKTLDMRVRVPSGHERLELPARKSVTEAISRGSVTLSLSVESESSAQELVINRDLVDRLLELHRELAGQVAPEPPRLETLLTVRGVIEASDGAEAPDQTEQRDLAIQTTLDEVIKALIVSRGEEGQRLHSILEGHLDTLEDLCVRAGKSDGARLDFIRDRMQRQVAELFDGAVTVPEERLAQEIALLATKADVREEIDRLETHCAAGRDLLKESEPVGRKLDFLCQELNREANTLCSKSASEELTRIGLEFKAVIDQFREQAQNVE